MRLIDADALKQLMIETLEAIKKNPKMDNQEAHILAAFHTVGEIIDDAPTADAVERKRGEWIKNEGRHGWHCSCCKVDNNYAYSWNTESGRNEFQDNFCPSCGADMRGEPNEGNASEHRSCS